MGELNEEGIKNQLRSVMRIAKRWEVDAEAVRRLLDEAFAEAFEEGAWMCSDGHMFRYARPPAYPPWCAVEGCRATGKFVWIVKDEVTSRDWLPEDAPTPKDRIRNATFLVNLDGPDYHRHRNGTVCLDPERCEEV
jgi:hypothetical protein